MEVSKIIFGIICFLGVIWIMKEILQFIIKKVDLDIKIKSFEKICNNYFKKTSDKLNKMSNELALQNKQTIRLNNQLKYNFTFISNNIAEICTVSKKIVDNNKMLVEKVELLNKLSNEKDFSKEDRKRLTELLKWDLELQQNMNNRIEEFHRISNDFEFENDELEFSELEDDDFEI